MEEARRYEFIKNLRERSWVLRASEISALTEIVDRAATLDPADFQSIFDYVFFVMSEDTEDNVREKAVEFMADQMVARRLTAPQEEAVLKFFVANILNEAWTEKIVRLSSDILVQGARSVGLGSFLVSFLESLIRTVEKERECLWWTYAREKREIYEGIRRDVERAMEDEKRQFAEDLAGKVKAVAALPKELSARDIEMMHLEVVPGINLGSEKPITVDKIEFKFLSYFIPISEPISRFVRRCKKIAEKGVKLAYRINPRYEGYIFVFTDDVELARKYVQAEEMSENPTLQDVPPEILARIKVPDKYVTAIWVGFKSRAGKKYYATHVFEHPDGQYILLSSNDKDNADFLDVGSKIEKAYNGVGDGITDRGSDICSVIRLQSKVTLLRGKNPLSQYYVAKQVVDFFRKNFDETSISRVYYHGVPDEYQDEIPTLATA